MIKCVISVLCNNKIMKTLQRQFQFEPSPKQRLYLKQKNYEQIMRKTHRSHLSIQEAVAKRMLNFQHRRKYQLPHFEQSLLYSNSRQSEQIENRKFNEKCSRIGEAKRHTYCSSNLMQPNSQPTKVIEVQTMKQSKRPIIKDKLAFSNTIYHEYFRKTVAGWRVKETVDKTQQKTEKTYSEEIPIKKTKKTKRLREKDNILNHNTQQGSFVSLIEKFKFENLKTTKKDNCLYIAQYGQKQEKKQRKTEIEFTPTRNKLGCNFTQKQIDKKLAPLFEKNSSKVVRKLSSLTPWQQSVQNQTGGTVQMVLHI